MPTFSRRCSSADEAYAAPRGLGHATHSIDDRTEVHAVLGSLSPGLASSEQAAHQLGQFHDGPTCKKEWTTGAPRTWRVASYHVAGEMRRAAEIVHQVTAGLGRAFETEATIAYDVRGFPSPANERHLRARHGLSL